MNKGVKYGLIAGVLVVSLYLLFYLLDPLYYFEFGLQLGTYLVNLIFMVLVVSGIKRDNGGFISFQKALSSAFLIVVISNLLFIIFDFILQSYINPDMPALAMAYASSKAIGLANTFGVEMSEEEMETMKQSLQDLDYKPSFFFSAMTYFQSLFTGFIGALIVSLIMKRERKIL